MMTTKTRNTAILLVLAASLAPGLPKRIFSRTLPANTTASCGTSAIWLRRSAGSASLRLTPSNVTRPDSGS